MRLLTRYIVWELLKTFSVMLGTMTLLLNLLLMGMAAWRHGLGFGQFALLAPYMLPEALAMTIPATMLFAACNVYGRMSGDNEITALKGAGVNPYSALAPCLVLAAFLSLTCVWLNDLAVSWGRHGAKRVVLESFEEIAYRMLSTQHSYATEKFSLAVFGVQGKTLLKPQLTLHVGESEKPFIAAADSAEISANPAEGKIRIKLRNVSGQLGDTVKYGYREEDIVELDLEDGARTREKGLRPSETPLRQVPGLLKQARMDLVALEDQFALKAAIGLLQGDVAAAISGGGPGEKWQIRDFQNQISRLRTEPPRRWANGFSCLCFAFVGAPVAIRLRNSDFLTSFFACFAPILLLYYPLMAFGVDQAKNGSLPPIAVWLANAAAVVVGLFQLRKVLRY